MYNISCIHVCNCRPHQHGGDVLAPLSDILNSCQADCDSVAVSLALQGLYYLCQAEVRRVFISYLGWGVVL